MKRAPRPGGFALHWAPGATLRQRPAGRAALDTWHGIRLRLAENPWRELLAVRAARSEPTARLRVLLRVLGGLALVLVLLSIPVSLHTDVGWILSAYRGVLSLTGACYGLWLLYALWRMVDVCLGLLSLDGPQRFGGGLELASLSPLEVLLGTLGAVLPQLWLALACGMAGYWLWRLDWAPFLTGTWADLRYALLMLPAGMLGAALAATILALVLIALGRGRRMVVVHAPVLIVLLAALAAHLRGADYAGLVYGNPELLQGSARLDMDPVIMALARLLLLFALVVWLGQAVAVLRPAGVVLLVPLALAGLHGDMAGWPGVPADGLSALLATSALNPVAPLLLSLPLPLLGHSTWGVAPLWHWPLLLLTQLVMLWLAARAALRAIALQHHEAR